MLNDQSVLITGGTGSFGKKFVETILKRYPEVKRIVIYSRDELKQFELKQKYPESKYPQLRFFIGQNPVWLLSLQQERTGTAPMLHALYPL